MAASALFELTVVGVGGHGSQPQEAKDPVLAAAHVITALQTLVSRETHPLRPAVVSVCTVHGGTAVNIIPDRVTLSGTLRTFDDAQADHLGERVREIAAAVAGAWGCTVEYRYHRYYPVTSNHAAEAALVAEVAEELHGPGAVRAEELPTMGAEDFSFLLQERPGAYFFVGGGAEGRSNATCHSPLYDFNDDLLLVGPRMYLRIVERMTGSSLVG
jgi:hippurate hydrolase